MRGVAGLLLGLVACSSDVKLVVNGPPGVPNADTLRVTASAQVNGETIEFEEVRFHIEGIPRPFHVGLQLLTVPPDAPVHLEAEGLFREAHAYSTAAVDTLAGQTARTTIEFCGDGAVNQP